MSNSTISKPRPVHGYTNSFQKKYKIEPKQLFKFFHTVRIIHNKYFLELELENLIDNNVFIKEVSFATALQTLEMEEIGGEESKMCL